MTDPVAYTNVTQDDWVMAKPYQLLTDDQCRLCYHDHARTTRNGMCADICEDPGPDGPVFSVCGCDQYVDVVAQSRIVVRARDEAVKMLGQLALLHAANDELLKRAYTLLVSVQPAAKMQEQKSPNKTALRLNRILVDAIQDWVDEYTAKREASRG